MFANSGLTSPSKNPPSSHLANSSPPIALTDQKGSTLSQIRFVSLLVFVLVLNSVISLWVMFGGDAHFEAQSTRCRFSIFSSFSIVLAMNLTLIIILARNLHLFRKKKQAKILISPEVFRGLIFSSCGQFSFVVMTFCVECVECKSSLLDLGRDFFGFQIGQFSVFILLSLWFRFQGHSDLSSRFLSDVDDPYGGIDNVKNINHDRSLEIERKEKRKSIENEKEVIEIQINIKDLDHIEIVKKSQEQRIWEAVRKSPTKRLTEQFKRIVVE